jgi:TPR repeat protein
MNEFKSLRYSLLAVALLLFIVSADFIAYKFSVNNRDPYVPAVRFLRPLAKLGLSTAQFNLAVRYDEGKDVAHDFNEAFKWYRKSADRGNTIAQFKLGVFYESGLNATGQGVPRDVDEAYKWYRKSAEQGYPPAQVQLGWLINSGLGAQQNFKEVMYWTRKAADQGYADAQFLLGWRYFFGKRVPQDFDAAAFWLNKAAQQGHGAAQHLMGVVQNDAAIINQIRETADQGDAESQYILGWLYFVGKHVPQDFKPTHCITLHGSDV